MTVLINKLINNLKNYNIMINSKTLEEIDINEIKRNIFILKSKKTINNTEYELLTGIISKLSSIHKYNDELSYKKLEEILNYLENYNNKSTENDSDVFKRFIQNLSSSSKESIVNAEIFNDFNKYLHVNRPIENSLIQELEKLTKKEKGIILLVGSVGDGKSHLLSYLKNNYQGLFENIEVYNDATESDDPYRTAVETLLAKFQEYYQSENKKLVIAINIGMLHNFISHLKKLNLLIEFENDINESEIFSNNGMKQRVYNNNRDLSIVSFLNDSTFEITNGELQSEFYNKLINKIFEKNMENPFYNSFLKDDGYSRKEAIYQNYALLLNEDVQETIKKLIIKIQIENKRMLTTRSLLNFLHDIIVPDESTKENDSLLVNLLFENAEKSSVLSSIQTQDPVLIQNFQIDKLNIEIYNSMNLHKKCEEIFGTNNFQYIKEYLYLLEGLNHKRKFQMIIRLHFLFNFNMYGSEDFLNFIKIISDIEKNKEYQKNIYSKVINAMYLWHGSPEQGYVYSENLMHDTKLRIGLELEPKLRDIKRTDNNSIIVKFEIQGKVHEIEIDYNLYKLLNKLEKGYLMKEKDKAEAVVFAEFIDNILNDLESVNTTIIYTHEDKQKYIVKNSFFGYEIGGLD